MIILITNQFEIFVAFIFHNKDNFNASIIEDETNKNALGILSAFFCSKIFYGISLIVNFDNRIFSIHLI